MFICIIEMHLCGFEHVRLAGCCVVLPCCGAAVAAWCSVLGLAAVLCGCSSRLGTFAHYYQILFTSLWFYSDSGVDQIGDIMPLSDVPAGLESRDAACSTYR
jgi:hypothetical protein